MKIAFATTQSQQGSTLIGRVEPLAERLAEKHDVHVLYLDKAQTKNNITYHPVGHEPFTRTNQGKQRLGGLSLIFNMLGTVFSTASTLRRLKPDVIIIVKTLPHNVLGAYLYSLLTTHYKLILDVDDFELTANKLTSLTQRATIHWAERTAAKLATHIITATPFLSDHFEQLTAGKKSVTMIPTGMIQPPASAEASSAERGRRSTPPQAELAPTERAVGGADAGGGPHLLYVGSLSISSGHRIGLLPAILSGVKKTHPNITLHIHGTGDDSTQLQQEFATKDLTKSVTWHGRFDHNNVQHLLTSGTILLDPVDTSIVNRAKSSYRVALAATFGLPVITSNTGIRPYLLPTTLHQRFFAEPGNAKSYAARISQIIATPLSDDDHQQLISHSKRYTWDKLAQQYSELIAK